MGKVREVVHKYLVRLPMEEAHHTCHTLHCIHEKKSVEKIAQEVRITLKTLTTLSYSSTDENVEDLEEIHKHLLQLMTKFKSKLPQQEGLLLRPQLRKQLKLSRQKKISLRSKHTKELPPSSRRGRKKANAAYRNRVGRKAQILREVMICMLPKVIVFN